MKITTKSTKANIEKVLALLAETPERLAYLSDGLPADQLERPLSPGEWSQRQVLAHLIACADVRSNRIYFALLLEDATVPEVHPQRQWEKLLRYGDRPYADLLSDFTLRREVLLSVLRPLSEADWGREVRGDKRAHSVFNLARNIALHEYGHCNDMRDKLPAFLGAW
jgi:hypothetical protein